MLDAPAQGRADRGPDLCDSVSKRARGTVVGHRARVAAGPWGETPGSPVRQGRPVISELRGLQI